MSAIDDQSTFCSRAAISAVRAWRWRELMTPLASQDAQHVRHCAPHLGHWPALDAPQHEGLQRMPSIVH